MTTVAELVVGGDLDAARKSRAFLRSSLEGHPDDLIADAELVASELVTNAEFHGAPPITVRILATDEVLRIEVEDAGKQLPIQMRQRDDNMTGRGLAVIAALASGWGVDPRVPTGKVVWAELPIRRIPGGRRTAPQMDTEAILGAWPDDLDQKARYPVRLGAVPTQLLLDAKAHIDNVVREVTLMRRQLPTSPAGHDRIRSPRELAELADVVTGEFAEARNDMKRQALEAARRGDTVTNLRLRLPVSAADAGERYLAALDQADRFARSAQMLTTVTPRVHRIFRRWYVRSLVQQLRAIEAGEQPPEARPFAEVLADEVTRLSELEDQSRRLSLLDKTRTALDQATTAEEMCKAIVEHATEHLGVEGARVRLLAPGGTLRIAAQRSRHGEVGTPDPEYSIDADLPGATAFRTRTPIYVRSLKDVFDRYSETTGLYAPAISGHFVPLVLGDECFGVLSMSFIVGELSDEAELTFVETLADLLAKSLHRP
jgi:hypothetical protein